MSSWRELAAQRVGDAALDGAAPTFYGLTGNLARDLRDLERSPPPRGVDRQAWSIVVADAIALARGGWVESALALGWTEIDLFGVNPRDSWEFSGLAVWLRGRQLFLVDERMALAGDADTRAVFHRGGWGHGRDMGPVTPVPLWRVGRG